MAKKTVPDFVPPLMANRVKEPFDSAEWMFEVKLDGCRAIWREKTVAMTLFIRPA
jgi:ATP-dependent DNA ligase